jgi:hypothetical protein
MTFYYVEQIYLHNILVCAFVMHCTKIIHKIKNIILIRR